MKRLIYTSTESDFEIPTLEEYLGEVDVRDKDIIKYLMSIKTFNGKLFSAPSSRNGLGKNPNYAAEDKCIQLSRKNLDSRTYEIPYNQLDRAYRVDKIYTFPLTIYNDGSFRFGDGKVRTVGEVSDSALSHDVYTAMNS